MRRAGLDVGQRLLDVVERAAARGAGDVFGVRETHAGRLQDHQLDLADRIFRKARGVDPDAVGQSVQQQRPQVGGGLHGEHLQRGLFIAAPYDHRFVGHVEIQDRGTQFGGRIARHGFDHAEAVQRLSMHDGHRHPRTAAVFGRGIAFGMPHLERSRTVGEMLHEQLRHGNLVLGSFGERHADRVADAVGQQGPDAHGALHTSLDAVSGLGDTQVYRVVHPFGIHRPDQQAVGGDHHAGVRRFHRDDHLIEIPLPADPQKLHRRDDHALRRVAPLVEDAFGQRTVVDADAQGDAPFAALFDKGFQFAVLRPVVAGVDAHLVHIAGGDGRDLGDEMDVGDHGRRKSVGTQLPDDVFQIFAFAASLRREAHDVSSGAVDALDLRHARGGVIGVGIGHRLHGDGVFPADRHLPDAHLARRAASEFRKIYHHLTFIPQI